MVKEYYSEYTKEIREYRLSFNKAYAYTAIALVLLGAGLDYGLYPHLQYLFGSARILTSLLIFCVSLTLNTKWGQDRAEMLAFTWLLLPQIMITWMIAVTEGATSLYSIGLYLAIFGSSIGLPFSLRLNIALSLSTFLLYLAACSFHPESFSLKGTLVFNSLLLLFVITISAVSTFFNERARFMLFRLKAELAEKNAQLEATNKSLADIKGHMLQQEKLASIGTLSAGLLHEVNNPVNYCLMAMDIALEDPATKKSESLKEYLSDAKDGMMRVQSIVSDLKTFAYRGSNSEVKHTDFSFEKVAHSAMRLVGYETKDITIMCALPEDTLVHGDEAAIVGVLVNLLNNAALAMHVSHCAKPEIHLSAAWQGNRLCVTVQDNGPGIAPENLARVFDPFFTTRDVGQGLGLGLSISYGIIEQHDGKLHAESVLGAWTKMIFDLPKAA